MIFLVRWGWNLVVNIWSTTWLEHLRSWYLWLFSFLWGLMLLSDTQSPDQLGKCANQSRILLEGCFERKTIWQTGYTGFSKHFVEKWFVTLNRFFHLETKIPLLGFHVLYFQNFLEHFLRWKIAIFLHRIIWCEILQLVFLR